MGGSIAWSRIRHGQDMEIGEEDATETPFIGQKRTFIRKERSRRNDA